MHEDFFKYSQKQLERKAVKHLPRDYQISIEGKTSEELGLTYFGQVEQVLARPNLILREDGTMNRQESATILLDIKSGLFASFENNPLHENHHFISSYEITPKAVEEFIRTGNIGEDRQTRKAKIDQDQKSKAADERIRQNANSFYKTLPDEGRIGYKELREVDAIIQKLKDDPNFSLTEKETNMMKRAEIYEQHKNQHYQDNPDLYKDEL